MRCTTSVGALITFFVAACGNSSPEVELQLRDGFQILYRSEIPARRLNGALGHEGQAFLVTDATASEDRVIIAGYEVMYSWAPTWHSDPIDPNAPIDVSGTGLGTYGGLSMFISEDATATWKRVGLIAESGSPVVSRIGIAESGGNAVASVYMRGSRDIPDLWLGPVDLETGRWQPKFMVGGDTRWETVGTNVVGHIWSGGNGGALIYDLQTHTLQTVYFPPVPIDDPAGCTSDAALARFDGHSIVSLCGRREPAEVCVARADLSAGSYDGNGNLALTREIAGCVPASDIDSGLAGRGRSYPGERLIWFRDAIWQPFERDGHVWMLGHSPISGAISGTPLDLGPGSIEIGGFGTLHPRLLNSLRIVDESGVAPPRLLVFPPNGDSFAETAIPLTPCRNDAGCGTAKVMAVRRIPRVGIVIAYDVRTDDHQYVVAGLVPDPVASRIRPDRSLAVEGGDVERACAALVSCFPNDASADLLACVDHWSQRRGLSDTHDLAYQSFLAAVPAGCDALRATSTFMWRSTDDVCAARGCVGDLALYCFEGGGSNVRNCLEYGTECRVGDDGNGHCGVPPSTCPPGVTRTCIGNVAFTCANTTSADGIDTDATPYELADCARLGLECWQGNCVDLAAPPCSDPPSHCEGDEFREYCTDLGPDGRATPGIDCSRVGLTCDPGEGCVSTRPDPEVPCIDNNVHCVGSSLTYCIGGELRYVDCKDIGHRRCEVDAYSRGVCVR